MPSIAINDADMPIYCEANSERVSIGIWNGSAWSFAVDPDDASLPYLHRNGVASHASLVLSQNGEPYCYWNEVLTGESSGLWVSRWNGSRWQFGNDLNAAVVSDDHDGGRVAATFFNGQPLVGYSSSGLLGFPQLASYSELDGWHAFPAAGNSSQGRRYIGFASFGDALTVSADELLSHLVGNTWGVRPDDGVGPGALMRAGDGARTSITQASPALIAAYERVVVPDDAPPNALPSKVTGVFAARYEDASWIPLGDVAKDEGNLLESNMGAAQTTVVTNAAGDIVIAYIAKTNDGQETNGVHLKRFVGNAWVEFAPRSATGPGIAVSNTKTTQLSLAIGPEMACIAWEWQSLNNSNELSYSLLCGPL